MGSFAPATKEKLKLRLALPAPTGGGKTYSALTIALALVGPKGTIAVIDTEHESARKYADKFKFDHAALDEFHPDNFIAKIREAYGYDCLILDSASHEWNGKGGCLELVEYFTKTKTHGNSYAAWDHVTPLHTAFIEALLSYPGHLIVTFRSKMDYVQTEKNGKKAVEKLGMAPVTRDGVEYEFDIVMELDSEHTGLVTKTRCEALDGKMFRKPGADFVKVVKAWLDSGVEAAPKPVPLEDAQQHPLATEPDPEPETEPEVREVEAQQAANPGLYGSAPPLGNPTGRVAELAAEAKQKTQTAIAEAQDPANVAAAQAVLDKRLAENYNGPKEERPANVIDHPAKAATEAFNAQEPVTTESVVTTPDDAVAEALEEPWDVTLDKATPDQGKWFIRKVKDTWRTILSAADIAALLRDPDWKKTHHQRSFEAVYGLIKTAVEAEDEALLTGSGATE